MYCIITYKMALNDDIDWSRLEGFDWDEGNVGKKNKLKHNVEQRECEEVFYDPEVVIFDDEVHSGQEKRYGALGMTHERRAVTIFFTIRDSRIRIISARDQSKKERKLYLVSKSYEK